MSSLWLILFVVLGICSYIVLANSNGNSLNGLFDFLSYISDKVSKYRNAPFESHKNKNTSQKDRK